MAEPDRYQLRTTLTKPSPEPDDLVLRELAFSTATKRLFYKDPVTSEIYPIAGKELFDLIGQLNRLPGSPDISVSAVDTARVLSGNLIAQATDPDGDAVILTNITYAGVEYSPGTQVPTSHGTLTFTQAGQWSFQMNDAAYALTNGQSATVNFAFRLRDSRGGVSAGIPFTVNITGTNQGPVAGQDAISIPPGQVTTGNLLSNDVDYEGETMTILRWSVSGDPLVHLPGQTVPLGAAGSMTLSANGDFSVSLTPEYYDLIPRVTYVVSDGTTEQETSVVLVALKPAPTAAETRAWFAKYRNGEIVPTNIAPNPLVGRTNPTFSPVENVQTWNYSCPLPDHIGADLTSYDFRVGPGMEYTEINQVPWLNLRPGDRVFIYWREQPYKHVIPLHVRGDLVRWIEVIGVRDPVTGAMPIIDGDGAIEDPTHCKFNDTHTSAGMVHVILPLGLAPTTYRPGYIHIHGLEIRNAWYGKPITRFNGTVTTWGNFAGGIKVMGGDHITISGCKIHDNVLGIFANSTPDLGPRFLTTHTHILFNHFLNNGLKDDYSTHNSYSEGVGTIYEYNYFDPITTGCNGDLLKDRSTGHIFRYNYFKCGGANALSLRDPEATYAIGNTSLDRLGALTAMLSFVYSNMFEMVQGATVVGYGDGIFSEHNEVRGGGFLCFYRNRVVQFRDGTGGFFQNIAYNSYCTPLLEFWNSRASTAAVILNNFLYSEKKTSGGLVSNIAVFAWKGVLSLSQSNFCHNVQPVSYDVTTNANRGDVAVFARNSPPYAGSMGSLQMVNSNVDPGFINAPGGDYGLLPSSPYYGLNAPYPAIITDRNLAPDDEAVMHPYGILPKPEILRQPSITGTAAAGQTVTAVPANFGPIPDTRLYEFLVDGVVVGTGLTLTLQSAWAGKVLVFRDSATNAAGTTVAESLPRNIATNTTPQVIQSPQITGPLQATYPIQVTQGTWTNDPVSFSVQWYKASYPELVFSPIPGPEGTSFTITPPESDIGMVYNAIVTVTNAFGESNQQGTGGRTILDIIFDPDAYGTFHFQGASGQTLAALDARWNGYLLFGSYNASTYYYCDGNGKLVGNYIARNNGGRAWFANDQADDVPVTIKFTIPATGGGDVGCALRVQAAGATHITFAFGISPMRVYVVRDRSSVNGASWPIAADVGTEVTMKVVPVNSTTYQIYINGSLFQTYVDPSPLVGGFPGFELNPGANETFGLDSWTDQP